MVDVPGRIVIGVTAPASLGLLTGLPEFLARQGWDVHVVCAPGETLDRLVGTSGVTTHSLPMARTPSPLSDAKGLLRWLRLLRRVRPDIVLLGTPKASLLGLLAAWLVRVPARIYHVRGLRMETTRGVFRTLLSFLERLSFAAATSAIAVSPSLRDRVTTLGLASTDKVVVLGRGSSNGVDVERFTPTVRQEASVGELRISLGLQSDVPVIGYVGRINRDKGLDTLVAASLRLEAAGVDHRLLIIGSTEAADSDVLAQLAESSHHPVLTGSVSDTAPYYGLIDILSLPTLREGFPNVALEAAASGVPVVTTDATGAVDSIVHGVTGVITPVSDADALTTALHDLLDSAERRRRMGTAGRDFVVQHFSRGHVQAELGAHLRVELDRHGDG